MFFNVVLEFLKVYWREILVGSLTILSFILCLVRRKPLNTVLADLYIFCIAAINLAEETELKGKDKLFYALDAVKLLFQNKYPEVCFNGYRNLVLKMIENILSTPQKKED